MGSRYYIIPVFVPHEGCPHDCVFCNQNSITGETEKVNEEVNAAFVEKTITEYLDTIKRDASTKVEVSFYGGTFTGIKEEKQKELLSVAKKYKDLGEIDNIRLSTRPDYIDENVLAVLEEYEVDIIELGVQSLDDSVLIASNRGHTSLQVERASKLIKSRGFTLGIQVMLGLPGDTFEKDIETAKQVVKLKPDIARIYPALVIKNTHMETMYQNKEYIPYTIDECVEIGSKIYYMFIQNNINVIRVGLQPTEDINADEDSEVVVGPFHPAIRELIESKIYNDKVYEIVKDRKGEITLIINPKEISKLYSNKKTYFNSLKAKLKDVKIFVIQDNTYSKGEIGIKINGDITRYNIYS